MLLRVYNPSNFESIQSIDEKSTQLETDKERVSFVYVSYLFQFGERPEQLHHVQINTVNHERCQQIFGTTPITDNMLCAHTEQRGLGGCNGDDGGPLLHNNVVIGVHSFHVGCSLTDRPGVYTRVSRYTDWILANAQN